MGGGELERTSERMRDLQSSGVEPKPERSLSYDNQSDLGAVLRPIPCHTSPDERLGMHGQSAEKDGQVEVSSKAKYGLSSVPEHAL